MPQSVLLISEGQVFCLLQLPLLSLFIALIVSRRHSRYRDLYRGHFSIEGFDRLERSLSMVDGVKLREFRVKKLLFKC